MSAASRIVAFLLEDYDDDLPRQSPEFMAALAAAAAKKPTQKSEEPFSARDYLLGAEATDKATQQWELAQKQTQSEKQRKAENEAFNLANDPRTPAHVLAHLVYHPAVSVIKAAIRNRNMPLDLLLTRLPYIKGLNPTYPNRVEKALSQLRGILRFNTNSAHIAQVRVVPGEAPPKKVGSSGGWFTKGGTPISHPGAYSKTGWSNMEYLTNDEVITVGSDYAKKTWPELSWVLPFIVS